jgi:hypothetical protein
MASGLGRRPEIKPGSHAVTDFQWGLPSHPASRKRLERIRNRVLPARLGPDTDRRSSLAIGPHEPGGRQSDRRRQELGEGGF